MSAFFTMLKIANCSTNYNNNNLIIIIIILIIIIIITILMGLKIKKNPQVTFWTPTKFLVVSFQFFSRSSQYDAIHRIWLFENIVNRSLCVQMYVIWHISYDKSKARSDEKLCLLKLYSLNLSLNHREIWMPNWLLHQNCNQQCMVHSTPSDLFYTNYGCMLAIDRFHCHATKK